MVNVSHQVCCLSISVALGAKLMGRKNRLFHVAAKGKRAFSRALRKIAVLGFGHIHGQPVLAEELHKFGDSPQVLAAIELSKQSRCRAPSVTALAVSSTAARGLMKQECTTVSVVSAVSTPVARNKRGGNPGKWRRAQVFEWLHWNLDTLQTSGRNAYVAPSVRRSMADVPLPPGRLQELARLFRQHNIRVVSLVGHRWSFTGIIPDCEGFRVFVFAALKQGDPSGVLLMFWIDTWCPAGFSPPWEVVKGRAALVKYRRGTTHMAFWSVLAPGEDHPLPARQTF